MDADEIIQLYMFRKVEQLLLEEGISPKTVQMIKYGLLKPETIEKLDSWSKRYLEGGKL